jgi:hypothetical protein
MLLATVLAGLMILFLSVAGSGQPADESQSANLKAQPTMPPAIELPAGSPERLKGEIARVASWTPKQVDRIDFALKGVTRIVHFAELGLGERLEAVMPRQATADWPTANSVRLALGKEKTAVVARFRMDTLAGPRVAGEGQLGVMGIHGDTVVGPDVKLARTMASAGRFELVYPSGFLFAQLACCDIPPTFGLDRYGRFGDTITLIFTFDPSLGTYTVSLIGREAGRTFPGFSYTTFRTERGEFHRDLKDYPYFCEKFDPAYVNLYFGSTFRGRKSQLEPVIKVDIF